MKINKYKIEQYAGSHDQEISFDDGINVVLGNNETGKSTMISAIYHGLISAVKVDKRRDKEFINTCFPSSGVNTIDVGLDISDSNCRYRLDKVWDLSGADSIIKFRETGGTVYRGVEAEKKLEEVMKYGNAVYENLVFANQANEEQILDWFYNFINNTEDSEISAVKDKISSALSAAGGISSDKFISLIDSYISGLGARWDFTKNQPEKGRDIDNKWASGRGEILDMYYAFREKEREWNQSRLNEQSLSELVTRENDIITEHHQLEKKLSKLEEDKTNLINNNKTRKLYENVKKNLDVYEKAEKAWPVLDKDIADGMVLLTYNAEHENRLRYTRLKASIDRTENLYKRKKELAVKLEPYADIDNDYRETERLIKEIQNRKSKLSAVKLKTSYRISDEYQADIDTDSEIKTVSGEGELLLSGYASIDIPGVASFMVAPEGLDVDECHRVIGNNESRLSDIYNRYNVISQNELDKLRENCRKNRQILDDISREIMMCEQYISLDDMKNELEECSIDESIELPVDLDESIKLYLRRKKVNNIESGVASDKRILQQFIDTYGSIEELAEETAGLKKEAVKYEEQLKQSGNILSCTEEELSRLIIEIKEKLAYTDRKKEDIIRQKATIMAKEQNNADELESEMQELEKKWHVLQAKYRNYMRIKEDFLSLTENEEDKFSDFYNAFNENLQIITDSHVNMVNMGDGVTIISGQNDITNKKLLSEGTRKTILLAFRLAILEYFYEDEPGVVVLDDVLLDMDPDRRVRAAALLKEFAVRNQVIFTTCDPEIAGLLGGKIITI